MKKIYEMIIDKPKQISKITLEDIASENYVLLAIITTLEDYKLAFHFNKHLSTKFTREINDIQLISSENTHSFSNYSHDDYSTGTFWRLIENKSHQSSFNAKNDSIRFEEYTSSVLFLPEFKNVDFLLKIEDFEDNFDLINLASQIEQIKNITKVYLIEPENIKSKKNLFL